MVSLWLVRLFPLLIHNYIHVHTHCLHKILKTPPVSGFSLRKTLSRAGKPQRYWCS